MSKRRKSPAEKKSLAYKKDRVLQVEYPHAFRRQLSRKKARSNRKERRQVRHLLDSLLPHQDNDARLDMPLEPIRRVKLYSRSGSTIPLGISVQRRLHERIRRTAWNFFKTPYNPGLHKKRFIAFLAQLTQGKSSPTTQKIAWLFQEALNPPEPLTKAEYVYRLDARHAWLQAFLADEPAWEERLRTWIAENIQSL
jgi:hypothetical protein